MTAQRQTSVSKIDAARRQLDCAIRLFFSDDDSLAIHTLGHAAFKIVFDLYPKQRGDGFDRDLSDIIARLGWRRFNRVPNFLKHADNDSQDVLEDHSPESVQASLGLACILHHRLTGRMTPEMRAFDSWMHLLHPETFEVPPDPDPEFDAVFRASIAVLKVAPWTDRLTLGEALLAFYRQHPDIGGWGAPQGAGAMRETNHPEWPAPVAGCRTPSSSSPACPSVGTGEGMRSKSFNTSAGIPRKPFP